MPATEPVTHQRWREDPLKVIDVLDVLNRTVVYIYFSTNCLYYKVHIISFSFSHITENDVNFCSYFWQPTSISYANCGLLKLNVFDKWWKNDEARLEAKVCHVPHPRLPWREKRERRTSWEGSKITRKFLKYHACHVCFAGFCSYLSRKYVRLWRNFCFKFKQKLFL